MIIQLDNFSNTFGCSIILLTIKYINILTAQIRQITLKTKKNIT